MFLGHKNTTFLGILQMLAKENHHASNSMQNNSISSAPFLSSFSTRQNALKAQHLSAQGNALWFM
jgi:hypothetical protein